MLGVFLSTEKPPKASLVCFSHLREVKLISRTGDRKQSSSSQNSASIINIAFDSPVYLVQTGYILTITWLLSPGRMPLTATPVRHCWHSALCTYTHLLSWDMERCSATRYMSRGQQTPAGLNIPYAVHEDHGNFDSLIQAGISCLHS